ncbi:MAG: protein translocase subunit SecF [Anaerolineae bacterium]|nr:protein translocase subunit SecF [Anaerolineae bacterium]MCB9132264.1 protein translocase subunit SecF [Anaerolineales bacterium]MCB0233685.1 protein translocase subunit SecF [Anaerolineae bacterium]MCB0237206.1 protein translocase subunit SecF [Anaerolineae bacterium]MCB0243572.1 protein translocase subunit SecF [Anaerolineae bacterium]
MYNIVQNRRYYYIGSAIIIGISLLLIGYSMVTTGQPFRLSIDFTGGVYWEFKLGDAAAPTDVRDVFVAFDLSDTSVTTVGAEGNEYQARLKAVDPDTKTAIEEQLGATFGGIETLQYRNVGPAVGREVTRSALIAVLFVAMAIVLFMVVAFRNVSHPVRYGVTAVVAMVHDVVVACGFAALMGVLVGWEVDALFLTALLTVLGFSVQDTIVVFDRVRENSARHRGEDFETICNRSLLETVGRSLTTQLNAMFIMVAILMFGGDTIKPFIAVLLIGMISGTYSSIFNATPLLVTWEKAAQKRAKTQRASATA